MKILIRQVAACFQLQFGFFSDYFINFTMMLGGVSITASQWIKAHFHDFADKICRDIYYSNIRYQTISTFIYWILQSRLNSIEYITSPLLSSSQDKEKKYDKPVITLYWAASWAVGGRNQSTVLYFGPPPLLSFISIIVFQTVNPLQHLCQ